MNKIVIPALLAATIMVAGAFAFIPVEQASTVHTTILSDNTKVDLNGAIALGVLDDDTIITYDCTADYAVNSIVVVIGAGTYTSDDVIDSLSIGATDIDVASSMFALVASTSIEVLESTLHGDVDEDVVLSFVLGTDGGDEDIVEVRFSYVSSGTCASTVT